VLGILAHAAPRILKVGACFSVPIVKTGCSMVAGCQQAVSFARGLLWSLVHELCYTLPRCLAHEHVDDLSQPVVASTSRDLREALVELGNVVGKHVQRLKIKLADKSTIVPISFATLGAAKDLADGPYAMSMKSMKSMNHNLPTINLRSTQGHFGFMLGSHWDDFGIILGSF